MCVFLLLCVQFSGKRTNKKSVISKFNQGCLLFLKEEHFFLNLSKKNKSLLQREREILETHTEREREREE